LSPSIPGPDLESKLDALITRVLALHAAAVLGRDPEARAELRGILFAIETIGPHSAKILFYRASGLTPADIAAILDPLTA
jgi:hypothetical protein